MGTSTKRRSSKFPFARPKGGGKLDRVERRYPRASQRSGRSTTATSTVSTAGRKTCTSRWWPRWRPRTNCLERGKNNSIVQSCWLQSFSTLPVEKSWRQKVEYTSSFYCLLLCVRKQQSGSTKCIRYE